MVGDGDALHGTWYTLSNSIIVVIINPFKGRGKAEVRWQPGNRLQAHLSRLATVITHKSKC